MRVTVAFDAEVATRMILDDLPARACWVIGGEPLRYNFSKARTGLVPVADEIEKRWFRETWRPLLIFGGTDYANGGGATPWLTIDSTSGAVMGLDLERDPEPMYVINSSLPRFIATFTYLDRFLARGQGLPHDAAEVVRSIDDAAYATVEWRELIEHLES